MGQTLKQLNKRLPALVLAVLLLLCCAPFAFAAEGEEETVPLPVSGSCGANLTWTVTGETLIIEGSGSMTDFTEPDMAPWYGWRDEITALVLPAGLTTVGDLAFYGFKYLDVIVIPDSVTRVGDYAFAHCERARMLTLGSGVTVIGDAAFSDCYALTSLRLPDGLRKIGLKGFYRCESIPTVTVPASVTELGVSAFGYCKSLVSANVQASIAELPEYCFYGCGLLRSITLPDRLSGVSDFSFAHCDNLTDVYYNGESQVVEEIKEVLNETVTGFEGTGAVSDDPPPSSVTVGNARDNGDGTITQENVTVTEGENTSLTSAVEYTHPDNTLEGGTFTADLKITVENENGWEEAISAVVDSLNRIESDFSVDGVAPPAEVTVYVKNSDTVDQGFVDAMAGRDVNLTVTTQNGSDWKVDCSTLQQGGLESNLDFTYERSDAPQETVDELEGAVTYLLKFASSAKINAEVMVKLPRQYATQTAYLYQRIKGELEFLQAVVIDHNGYAHFYLGSVDSETEYIVGINVPNADTAEVIIPKELQAEYGITENIQPVEYVITGRTSSWGMTGGQVTWILAAVMAVSVIGIGVVMFALNKRKLKMGYVPDLDDEEY